MVEHTHVLPGDVVGCPSCDRAQGRPVLNEPAPLPPAPIYPEAHIIPAYEWRCPLCDEVGYISGTDDKIIRSMATSDLRDHLEDYHS